MELESWIMLGMRRLIMELLGCMVSASFDCTRKKQTRECALLTVKILPLLLPLPLVSTTLFTLSNSLPEILVPVLLFCFPPL